MTCLLNSFQVDRVRSLVSFPQWDLSLTLGVLTHLLFHLANVSHPICIPAKATFVLLLASVRHCGEIHTNNPNCCFGCKT